MAVQKWPVSCMWLNFRYLCTRIDDPLGARENVWDLWVIPFHGCHSNYIPGEKSIRSVVDNASSRRLILGWLDSGSGCLSPSDRGRWTTDTAIYYEDIARVASRKLQVKSTQRQAVKTVQQEANGHEIRTHHWKVQSPVTRLLLA